MNQISAAQLAALADCDPSWVSRHRDQLPPAAVLHDGQPGRPAMCWNLSDLAEWIADNTAGMTDAQCRLIAACRLQPDPRSKQTSEPRS